MPRIHRPQSEEGGSYLDAGHGVHTVIRCQEMGGNRSVQTHLKSECRELTGLILKVRDNIMCYSSFWNLPECLVSTHRQRQSQIPFFNQQKDNFPLVGLSIALIIHASWPPRLM